MGKGKILEGVVVSDKMAKTITVQVTYKIPHPMYKKYSINRKKYKAHNPANNAKAGDRVRIVECSPISKDKRFRLLEIVK